jgi:hypothetical protein
MMPLMPVTACPQEALFLFSVIITIIVVKRYQRRREERTCRGKTFGTIESSKAY